MIETLLDLGADINIQDNEKNTVLHLAVYSSDTNMIKKLLIRGANKYLKNDNNLTAFEMAVNMNKVEIAAILKKKTFTEQYFCFEEELSELKPKRNDIVMLIYFGIIALIDFSTFLSFLMKNEVYDANDSKIYLIICFTNECVLESLVTDIVLLLSIFFYIKLIINMYCHCNKIYEAKGHKSILLTVNIKL